jgi:hypothetical protein
MWIRKIFLVETNALGEIVYYRIFFDWYSIDEDIFGCYSIKTKTS